MTMKQGEKVTLKKLHSIADVAATLGMSVTWVDKAIRDGKINCITLIGKRMVHQTELDRIMIEGVK